MSADGTKVAFTSYASDLGPTDTNGHWDVYLRDLTAGTTTLVSVNAAGTDSGNSQSGGNLSPAISADGTKVAFASSADDLGPADTNDRMDVYVRDLTAGITTLVSVDASGSSGGDGHSFLMFPRFEPEHAFSPDGSKLLIHSEAGNLGPTDSTRPTEGQNDVYVRDLAAGTTTLVSANAAGRDSGNGWSGHATFSADGARVVFSSLASDLGPAGTADTNADYDIFIRDLATGSVQLVSTNASGTASGNGGSQFGELSPDGSQVLFVSGASDLGPTDTVMCTSPFLPPYNCPDIYVRDLATGTTTLVSANAAGTDGSTGAGDASFGAGGTKVVFVAFGSTFGPTDTNGREDVYVRDLGPGTTTLVSTNADGTDSANLASNFPIFAGPAGTHVIFNTAATNLGPQDNNGGRDLYLASLT